TSFFTAVHMKDEQLIIEKCPVTFSMVRPGETILVEA
ncbi:MAG: hypothetical protein RLZZ173_1024, partial [Pseudomonadota bacterium]